MGIGAWNCTAEEASILQDGEEIAKKLLRVVLQLNSTKNGRKTAESFILERN